MTLTRDKIKEGWIQAMLRQDTRLRVLSELELVQSREACLAKLCADEPVWVFGYGSLIWNPCFHFAEQRIAKVVGWHRRFCLWTHLGRGTPERPGLMLGLERGGSCRGIAYRLAPEEVEAELAIIWRREMVTAAYVPTWVRIVTPAGPASAITFTINRRHERYACKLDEACMIEALALAEGPLGTNRDYLFKTVVHLEELGLRDHGLWRLWAAVRDRRQALETVATDVAGTDGPPALTPLGAC